MAKRACLALLSVTSVMLAFPTHAHDTWTAAFECRGIPHGIDAALRTRGIPTDATEVQLKEPIHVFGFPVTRVSVFREGGEDVYRAYIRGSLAEVKAAAEMQRPGRVVISQASPEVVMVACTITTEQSED